MSSSVVMLKLWQALQDGESLAEEDIFGCIQRNIVLSGSAFSNLEKTDSRARVLSKEYASVCSESYRGTEDTAKPSKNLFGNNLSEKIKKISEENKLFKQASKFASDNYQSHSSKGFQPFRKGYGFSHNQFLRNPKPGAIPHQGELFSDQSQKEELQIQKRNLPLNMENQILSGKLVQINFRQDCFTNDKRTSNFFPILSKTTENNPGNSPSFEKMNTKH